MPASLDISAGLMEPDEGMKSTQVREGTEEVVRFRDGTVLLPDIVKETGVTERVTSTIAEAIEDSDSPFEHGFDVEFYSSRIEVPTRTYEIWIQGHTLHDWETGVTVEEQNSPSYELVNYLVEEPEADVNPLDTEVVQDDGSSRWLNRTVYRFHPMTGEAELYRSGGRIFKGRFEGMLEELKSQLGNPPGATPKVRAALKGLPTEENRIYPVIDFDEEVEKFFDPDS